MVAFGHHLLPAECTQIVLLVGDVKVTGADRLALLMVPSACKENDAIQEYAGTLAPPTIIALMMKFVMDGSVSQDVDRTLIVLMSSHAYRGSVLIHA